MKKQPQYLPEADYSEYDYQIWQAMQRFEGLENAKWVDHTSRNLSNFIDSAEYNVWLALVEEEAGAWALVANLTQYHARKFFPKDYQIPKLNKPVRPDWLQAFYHDAEGRHGAAFRHEFIHLASTYIGLIASPPQLP